MRDIEIPAIKRFQKGDRLHVQAAQIWLILVAFVSSPTRKEEDDQTMTYGQLATLMGYDDRQAGHTLGRQLGIVGYYCKRNNIPPLNCIVVNKETRMPGAGVVLRDDRTVLQEQRAVMKMKTDWFRLRVPTTGTFRKVWESEN